MSMWCELRKEVEKEGKEINRIEWGEHGQRSIAKRVTKIEMAPERWLLVSDEKRVKRKAKKRLNNGGLKVELNLYLSSDVMPSLFSTVSITLAFMCY